MPTNEQWWKVWAPYWDQLEDRHLGTLIADAFAESIAGPVLVVGGGQGLVIDQLVKKGLEVHGIDLEPQMIGGLFDGQLYLVYTTEATDSTAATVTSENETVNDDTDIVLLSTDDLNDLVIDSGDPRFEDDPAVRVERRQFVEQHAFSKGVRIAPVDRIDT